MNKALVELRSLLVEWFNSLPESDRKFTATTTKLYPVKLIKQDWGGRRLVVGSSPIPMGLEVCSATFLLTNDKEASPFVVTESDFALVANADTNFSSFTEAGVVTLHPVDTAADSIVLAIPKDTSFSLAPVDAGYQSGPGSNDLQHSRTAPMFAATGRASVISGGVDNVAYGDYSAVIGGRNNMARGVASIAGGDSSIAIGSGAIALGTYNQVVGPLSLNSATIGGLENLVQNGAGSVIIGGDGNRISIDPEDVPYTLQIGITSAAILSSSGGTITTRTPTDPTQRRTVPNYASVISSISGTIAGGANSVAIIAGQGRMDTLEYVNADIISSAIIAGNSSCGMFVSSNGGRISNSMIAAGVLNIIEPLDGNAVVSSAIVGGYRNLIARSFDSVIIGGMNNTLSSSEAGTWNSDVYFAGAPASSTYANMNHVSQCDVILGGFGNIISSARAWDDYGGNDSTANRFPCAGNSIAGGILNKVQATGHYLPPASTALGTGPGGAAIGGGARNIASGSLSTIPGGSMASTRGIRGMFAYASGGWTSNSTAGSAQFGMYVQRAETTTATTRYLSAAGSAGWLSSGGFRTDGLLYLPTNSSYAFDAMIVARATNAETKSWSVKGMISRTTAGVTALVGTPTVTVIANSAGASAWTVAAVAEDTVDALVFSVTGAASTTIKWCGVVHTTEISM